MLYAVDNTGARGLICIKAMHGYRRRYANITDLVVISIRSLRVKRREAVKTMLGEVHKAVVLRTRTKLFATVGDSISFLGKPVALLLSKQRKIMGTRIFGLLPKKFRFSKYLKILSICAGVLVF